MKSYPILFGFRDPVFGRGFVAFVATDGRALLTEEDDGGAWLYGVNPGGMAGGGKNRDEAEREFKVSYLSVLFDIAKEAASFDAFKAETERFFHEVNADAEAEWTTLHAAVRSGTLNNPELPRVRPEDRPPAITVVVIHEQAAEPSKNQFDNHYAAAA